jgi:hypothetical protein
MLALDETRNYVETDRELLLRREAEVVLGRDGRRCWTNADLCDSYNRRRLAQARGLTAKRLPPREDQRRFDRGSRSRAYAPAESSGAATSVHLAAAIAQTHQRDRKRANCWCSVRAATVTALPL